MAFGRLEKPAGHRPMSDINVTPLVDVMLVLLVIFILAAPLMASRLALELPKTEAAGAPAVDASAAFVALSVDAQGQAYWDDQPIEADALRQRLQATAERDPATELQLRADTAVPYGRVVQLIALAQTAGLSRIGFVADPTAPAPSVPAPAR
ncbi:MAG: biopolymer transporter ExbD [Hydrogenophaga sp.]|jgi:biopolymer transport protein TolR|uniref:ExbD/TolR family protein n=1 Tax=Hydrogenophaga sp. TaxID=1904254 RepID=UPI0027173ABE|nr:biopolymer transporter ExbD [Hydrogenophaga sp.]MDO9572135.1 biopolymer transporter ExbD [Hydrogenophaga sp.]MDP1894875.1 biopolymer transporter ExbD [Hydrogenophaga sp.]MDP2092602.1 biopolymer transporter ExbD [Hydrogenophaga sp.]MDP2220301.1 biopolymer transporter ExbD [Hydrogenophaga sp.]MDP3347132.1 biopolymer transporter ExbD [Hydrogenophaga sp.]